MKNLGQLLPILIVIAGLCGSARAALAQPNNAVIMITSVDGPGCQGQNHTAAWVVVVYKPYKAGTYSNRADQRYVSSLNKCTMIPIKTSVGSGIGISGIMEGRFATYGLAPQVNDGPGCFNVEAYSVGLATGPVPAISLQPGEDFYNPQDPNNIINDQGYGLWWAETFDTFQPAFGAKVVGCGHRGCQISRTVYNTDTGLQPNPGCDVLAPIL